MAAHLVNGIPTRLSMWRRVRAYAVPPSMIDTAAARRAAGDWAGACATARVDVDLRLRAVRDRHGTDLLTRLRADLRRLAPDLLRWHMPRIAPDGLLRPGLTVALARYPRADGAPLHLVVRTPPARADAGQRMSLALWRGVRDEAAGDHPHPHPDRRFRLDLHRHLWDAERAGELARRSGADEPAPDGRVYAWATARWAAEAALLLRADDHTAPHFTVRLGTRDRAAFELIAGDDRTSPAYRRLLPPPPSQELSRLPVLPEAAARTLPDLELLRAGLITPGLLHPLVAASLTPYAPPPGGDAPAAGPPFLDPHRVECRGEIHRIALRDGRLTAVDHDPAQLRREHLLAALGGPPLLCLRAIDAVHRAPEALPAVRERLRHGDAAGALDLVEGLLGSAAVLRDGPLRDELETAAARRVEHGVFRAGLDGVRPSVDALGDCADGRRRSRLGRRAPRDLRARRARRARPRTGQTR